MVRFLVVEDDDDVARAFETCVRRAADGARIFIVDSLAKAKALCAVEKMDGIVHDLKLADAQPRETLRWIGEMRAGGGPPVLIVTGVEASAVVVNGAYASGAQIVCKGPYAPNAVTAFAVRIDEQAHGVDEALATAIADLAQEWRLTPPLRRMAACAACHPDLKVEALAEKLGIAPRTAKDAVARLLRAARKSRLDEVRITILDRARRHTPSVSR